MANSTFSKDSSCSKVWVLFSILPRTKRLVRRIPKNSIFFFISSLFSLFFLNLIRIKVIFNIFNPFYTTSILFLLISFSFSINSVKLYIFATRLILDAKKCRAVCPHFCVYISILTPRLFYLLFSLHLRMRSRFLNLSYNIHFVIVSLFLSFKNTSFI